MKLLDERSFKFKLLEINNLNVFHLNVVNLQFRKLKYYFVGILLYCIIFFAV